MLYAIISEDVADSLDKRISVRPSHLNRLQELQNAGRLIVAGPHPAIDTENPGDAGFTGSLIVAEFDNLQAAQQWADADPYIDAGVYAKITVKPFKKVFPQ
ncbi:MAG: YciI family protein [Methylococcaceae bacterium]